VLLVSATLPDEHPKNEAGKWTIVALQVSIKSSPLLCVVEDHWSIFIISTHCSTLCNRGWCCLLMIYLMIWIIAMIIMSIIIIYSYIYIYAIHTVINKCIVYVTMYMPWHLLSRIFGTSTVQKRRPFQSTKRSWKSSRYRYMACVYVYIYISASQATSSSVGGPKHSEYADYPPKLWYPKRPKQPNTT